MSVRDGGPHKCVKDGFTTEDPNEWNEHCSKKEGDTTHITEEGAAPCVACGTEVEFDGMPFVPFDERGQKTIIITCDECDAKSSSTRKARKK